MSVLRFFDGEDAAQPNPIRIGQEGFELARAADGGLPIVPTLIIGTGVFGSYQKSDQLDHAVISSIILFAAESKIEELTITPTTAREMIGLPGPERTAVERNNMRYLIERIYRSWNDSRARGFRETHRIADDQAHPAIIVQIPRSPYTLSLSTRNPRTGVLTSAKDYKYNVNNRITGFRDAYATLIDKVEKIRGRPTQIHFQEDGEGLYIVGLGAQVMSTTALLEFVGSQHAAGRLDDIEALSMVEARMLGMSGRSVHTLSSKDSWIFRGVAASSGVASGYLVWPGSPMQIAASRACIFVPTDHTPDDLPIMLQCIGAFSTRGSHTSHLAVVSRGLKIPAVTGIEELELDIRAKVIRAHGRVFDGDFAAVDGSSGIVSLGKSSVMRTVTEFRNTSPVTFIDWLDDLAQSVVDRGEFATLSVEMQTHIAGLRRMIRKIRAGHD